MNYPVILLSDGAVLAIFFAVLFLIGLLILVLAGVNYVKKDRVYIIEKLNSFDRVLKPGWHYLAPFIYSIVGRYKTGEQKAIISYGIYGIEVTYLIEDPEAYHYAGHCFLEEFDEVIRHDSKLEPTALQDTLIQLANNYFITIVAIDIYKKQEENTRPQ